MTVPMMLMTALGDAYGACFEYADPTPDCPNDHSGYHVNPAYPAIGEVLYTDDTQMAIAVAETLIGSDLSREAFANAFVTCYQRDPRAGYSRTMQQFIASCRDGTDLLCRIRPQSDRSGAAMRACPIGTLPNEAEVLRVAELQARITHDTDGGVAAAQGAALMAHGLLYGRCDRAVLPAYLAEHVPGPLTERWVGPVGSRGMDSVGAALWAVVEHQSLAGILRAAVAYTGDVDTVAAVALGAACCSPDVVDDLPAVLHAGLEDGHFGQGYLVFLDRLLAGLRQASRQSALEVSRLTR